MPRDPALDDLSVLNDPNWKPPSASDIADWSRSAVRIISMSDDLGSDLNQTLAESQRIRSQVLLRRSSLESSYESEELSLNKALSSLPSNLEQYDALRKREKQVKLAEMKTREMLIADGFLDPSMSEKVLQDDAALVELGSQRLHQILNGTDELAEEVSTVLEIVPEHSEAIVVVGGEEGKDMSEYNNKVDSKDDMDTVRKSATQDIAAEKKSKRTKKVGRKRLRKRGKQRTRKGAASQDSPKSALQRKHSGRLVPSVTENLEASSRVLDVMEAERHREVYREEMLASLKGEGDEKKYAEMQQIFAREKRQAEKMIQQMLLEYTPRPLPRSKASPKAKKSSMQSERRAGGGQNGGSPSPLVRDAKVLESMRSSARVVRTKFSTKNRLPGATLEVEPPSIPDDIEKETIELSYNRPVAHDGKTVLEPSVRGLISDHTQAVNLDFPEIEKYKRPGQEFARWKEKPLG